MCVGLVAAIESKCHFEKRMRLETPVSKRSHTATTGRELLCFLPLSLRARHKICINYCAILHNCLAQIRVAISADKYNVSQHTMNLTVSPTTYEKWTRPNAESRTDKILKQNRSPSSESSRNKLTKWICLSHKIVSDFIAT